MRVSQALLEPCSAAPALLALTIAYALVRALASLPERVRADRARLRAETARWRAETARWEDQRRSWAALHRSDDESRINGPTTPAGGSASAGTSV